ncbi:MAG: Glu-tRNA(Gln) amidotransferase subunit GatE [Nanoarchaeota archaeon]
MTDYKAIGFRAGLEIHQQLAGKKLFCSCPCEIRKDAADFTVKRRLRASAGELGGIDSAARHEESKAKYFLYQGYHDTTCLVELDEEPPHNTNPEAITACLKVCKLLNATIPSHFQFMRKVVIDGSNTTGFQRTALVGRNGHLTLSSGKKIGIPTVCLEEEACQPIKREKDHDTYNLSRLGIPLIEIATDPSLSTPEEAKEAAEKIGMILRSVDGMKRGIGTIRQDVNVSITGGARVEVKGFQEHRSIPKVIAYEIERQLKLIKTGKKVEKEVRGAQPDFTTLFLRPMPGAHRMYPETDIPIINIGNQEITVGKTLEEQEAELVKTYHLNKDLTRQIIREKIPFEKYARAYPAINAGFIAETLVLTPKDIKARYKLDINITDHIDSLFEKLSKNEITKSAIAEILITIAQGKKPDFSKYKSISDEEIETVVKKLIKKHSDVTIGGLMGLAMQELRGKADGKKVMDIIKRLRP